MTTEQGPGARTPSDQVVLTALRWAVGVSVEAADRIGTVSPPSSCAR
ncbi:hypothetical protein SAMN04488107_1569 [Geodermatophilus saharensis]|uniref:Uncharacterized protein n=1 Tax=Geodermatophilus saharensis TaxID=1137994 RepID=A0A239C301_9ACTN|nr:hypothetical protein SAMN04488107_1569 [Geodermatophilus saharensis]